MNAATDVNLNKRKNETQEQFEFRKSIYLNVFNDIKDHDKALIYSNMWVNILSLECSYPKEIMDEIEKYKPSENQNIYLIKQ